MMELVREVEPRHTGRVIVDAVGGIADSCEVIRARIDARHVDDKRRELQGGWDGGLHDGTYERPACAEAQGLELRLMRGW